MGIRKCLVMAALAGASVSASAAAQDVQAQAQIEAPPSPEAQIQVQVQPGLPACYTQQSDEANAYALEHFTRGPVIDASSVPCTFRRPPSGDRLRIRWGADSGLGTMLGETVGFGWAIGGRIGVQINDLLGVYYQPRFVVAVGGSGDDEGGVNSLSVAYGLYSSLMADVTFFDLLSVGGGVSLDYGVFASADEESGALGEGAFFGLDFRVGLSFGGERGPSGRRGGFTLNVDAHPTFVGGEVATTLFVSAGFESY